VLKFDQFYHSSF